MTLVSGLALFAAMLVLAFLPGPGILVVVSRALSGGFRQGAVTTLGIVTGDYVFIILSVYGLAALAQSMGDLFVWVRYLGAVYLFWLGLSLLRAKPETSIPLDDAKNSSGLLKLQGANFIAGLLTTLSNPKAILFYLSFFPAFLDLSRVSAIDLISVLLITTLAVGGVMLGYAFVAVKAKQAINAEGRNRLLNRISCLLLVCSGFFMLLRGN